MAYFRKLGPKLEKLLDLLDKNERWLIVIVADPDAMASAMARPQVGRATQARAFRASGEARVPTRSGRLRPPWGLDARGAGAAAAAGEPASAGVGWSSDMAAS